MCQLSIRYFLLTFTLCINLSSSLPVVTSATVSSRSSGEDNLRLPAAGVAAVTLETVSIQDWQVEVTVGWQEFNLTIDTGSSGL